MSRPGRFRFALSPWSAALVAASVLGVTLVALGAGEPYPGDEARFIGSSRAMVERLSVEHLRTYEEMSGPLPFLYYGAWGRAFGFGLASMRLAAVMVGIAAAAALWGVLDRTIASPAVRDLTFGWLLVSPYFLATGVFAYTDMPGLLGLLLALCGALDRRAVWVVVGTTVALTSRQYLVFGVGAIGLWALLEAGRLGWRESGRLMGAVALGAVPLGLLVWLWGGLSPANEMSGLYLDRGWWRWDPASAVMYAGALPWYLLPLVAWRARRLFGDWRVVAGAAAVSAVYLVWPVAPSPSAVAAGYQTVGLGHRALAGVFGLRSWWIDAVWWLGLAAGLVVLWHAVRGVVGPGAERWVSLRSTHPTRGLPGAGALPGVRLMGAVVVCFFVVMPVSYLRWEKYLLPVLPAAAVVVHAAGGRAREGEPAGGAGGGALAGEAGG